MTREEHRARLSRRMANEMSSPLTIVLDEIAQIWAAIYRIRERLGPPPADLSQFEDEENTRMIPALGRALEGARKRDIVLNGSLYLRRYTLWGHGGDEDTPECLGHSGFVHKIVREDAERHLHDHPWTWALAVILSGGYEEERQVGDRVVRCSYREGSLNLLMPGTYHRISSVQENTWTLFLCGAKHSNSWGFLVEGKHVSHEEYFRNRPGAT